MSQIFSTWRPAIEPDEARTHRERQAYGLDVLVPKHLGAPAQDEPTSAGPGNTARHADRPAAESDLPRGTGDSSGNDVAGVGQFETSDDPTDAGSSRDQAAPDVRASAGAANPGVAGSESEAAATDASVAGEDAHESLPEAANFDDSSRDAATLIDPRAATDRFRSAVLPADSVEPGGETRSVGMTAGDANGLGVVGSRGEEQAYGSTQPDAGPRAEASPHGAEGVGPLSVVESLSAEAAGPEGSEAHTHTPSSVDGSVADAAESVGEQPVSNDQDALAVRVSRETTASIAGAASLKQPQSTGVDERPELIDRDGGVDRRSEETESSGVDTSASADDSQVRASEPVQPHTSAPEVQGESVGGLPAFERSGLSGVPSESEVRSGSESSRSHYGGGEPAAERGEAIATEHEERTPLTTVEPSAQAVHDSAVKVPGAAQEQAPDAGDGPDSPSVEASEERSVCGPEVGGSTGEPSVPSDMADLPSGVEQSEFSSAKPAELETEESLGIRADSQGPADSAEGSQPVPTTNRLDGTDASPAAREIDNRHLAVPVTAGIEDGADTDQAERSGDAKSVEEAHTVTPAPTREADPHQADLSGAAWAVEEGDAAKTAQAGEFDVDQSDISEVSAPLDESRGAAPSTTSVEYGAGAGQVRSAQPGESSGLSYLSREADEDTNIGLAVGSANGDEDAEPDAAAGVAEAADSGPVDGKRDAVASAERAASDLPTGVADATGTFRSEATLPASSPAATTGEASKTGEASETGGLGRPDDIRAEKDPAVEPDASSVDGEGRPTPVSRETDRSERLSDDVEVESDTSATAAADPQVPAREHASAADLPGSPKVATSTTDAFTAGGEPRLAEPEARAEDAWARSSANEEAAPVVDSAAPGGGEQESVPAAPSSSAGPYDLAAIQGSEIDSPATTGDELRADAGEVSTSEPGHPVVAETTRDEREQRDEPAAADPESAQSPRHEPHDDQDEDVAAPVGTAIGQLADAQPTDAQPTDAQPTDAQPTDAQPTDAQPTDAQPTDAQPTETVGSAEAAPAPVFSMAGEPGPVPQPDDDDILVSRETTELPPAASLPPNVNLPMVFRPTLPRPVKTRIFVVANQKGGVGKTTTAVNMAAALAGSGARVLVVDLDPQGNASTALGIEHGEGAPGIYDVVVDRQPMEKFVHGVPRFPTLWAVPATIDLSGAELELATVVARESRLKRALDTYLRDQEAAGERFDYVMIDCPPSLGLLTMNALVAGQEVLVPIQCEYYALEGVETLFKIVELVRELNQDLIVSTVLLTMYDARTRLSAQVAENARENLGPAVLRTSIPRSVRISEAPSFGQTAMTWDPGSSGALSYLEAARELAHRDPAAPPPGRPPQDNGPGDGDNSDVLGSTTAEATKRGDVR
ncbi:AAA family ATPase [Actinopolymorpha rutila]|uniref:Cellulose biosynthesis protein BcsQ n=1 Tax=Actinopolymorpha rutila TaxID=446787 RepID=A0A852Z246_9ACTN|nr:cellulose biosynthesis protein BcsQ [Actinopolymorpha rutila]